MKPHQSEQSRNKVFGFVAVLLALIMVLPVNLVSAVDLLGMISSGVRPAAGEKDPAAVNAEAVNKSISRLYRMHLKQEPGNWGLSFYSDKIQNEGWTLAQVEEHMKSTETYKKVEQSTLKDERKAAQELAANGAFTASALAESVNAPFASPLDTGVQVVLVADGLTRVPENIATLTDFEKNPQDAAAAADLTKTGARSVRLGAGIAQNAGILAGMGSKLGSVGNVAGTVFTGAGTAASAIGMGLNAKQAYDRYQAGDKQGAALSALKAGLGAASVAAWVVPGAQVLWVPIGVASVAVTAYEHREDLKELGQKAGKGIKNAAGKAGKGIQNAAGKVGHGIQNTAGKVGRGIQAAAGKVGNWLSTPFKRKNN